MTMQPSRWETVHEINGNNNVAIRIQRRGDFSPQYSMQIGRRRPQEDGEVLNAHAANDERLQPFIPVPVRVHGTLELDRSLEDVLRAAHDWIAEDVKAFMQARKETPRTAPARDDSEDRGRGRDHRHAGGRRGR